jgi:DNA repair exonuclease SbcCD ATPase subunit
MEQVKIKKVDALNLKAISQFTAMFNGKCAHVTGANGIGKSTIIRAFTDRLRGLKPSIITKIGKEEGKTVMELTDGCRFEWEYNAKGKDSLSYYTPDSVKPVRRDVFKHICGQYFPNQFDINKFLTTTEPRKRLQMISELLQVDLTEVQGRYKIAFDIRRDAKRDLKTLEAQIKPKPEEKVFEDSNLDFLEQKVKDIGAEIDSQEDLIKTTRTELNTKYLENKKANDEKESKHKEEYKKELDSWLETDMNRKRMVKLFNDGNDIIIKESEDLKRTASEIIYCVTGTDLIKFVDIDSMQKYIESMPLPAWSISYDSVKKPELKPLNLPDPMPDSSELNELDETLTELKDKSKQLKEDLEAKKQEHSEIETAKQLYKMQLDQWSDFQKQIQEKQDYVGKCELDVEAVHNEIKEIISKTKLPEEFSIDLTNKNDILFRTEPGAEYLPITVETLASSAIFIAAFKLQANYLDAFRVAHFDVSYLDYENRQKVLAEAIKMDIQLITESPALDEGKKELQYVITEV